MFEKEARQLLQSRSEVDAELRDMTGQQDEYQISGISADLDSVAPDEVIKKLDSSPASEAAFDCSELLQDLCGLDKAEADSIAYSKPLQTPAHESRPLKKRAIRECRTESELLRLDLLLLKAAGCDPRAFGF